MLKKFIAAFLAMCSIAFFCSCSDYREVERGYLVTALCFESEGQGIEVRVEALVPRAYNSDEPKTQILSAEGENATDAVKNLELTLTKELYFDHCAALMLESGISAKQISNIIDYCKENNRLSLGLYVVSADDIDAVLEIEPASGAVGFDIMNLMKKLKNKNKKDYNNCLYEVEKSMLESTSQLSLPIIKSVSGRVQV